MDPYLEGSEWGSFYIELSVEIRRRLSAQLSSKYSVRAMRRFIMEMPESVVISRRDIYPDTAVIHETAPVWTAPAPPRPVQVATLLPQEIPHYVVEIYAADKKELVTSIEVLSPANKRGKGYFEYLEKRVAILQSRVHLIEIDWLRRGHRVPMDDSLPQAPYYIFLSRAQKRPILDVWPIQIHSKLPTIPVPLLPEDEDVRLDCQQMFDDLYESLGFAETIDYSQPPEVGLAAETAVFAQAILQQAGAVQSE